MEADDGESVEIENIIINRISAKKVTEGTYTLSIQNIYSLNFGLSFVGS